MSTSTNSVQESEPGTTHIPRSVLWDEQVYEREKRTIFRKCWLFLGHESEISSPGDYVTRRLGEDSVIVNRDENGAVRVFLNSCPHRGNQLCKAGVGNSSHFRCSYHGWTFTNGGDLRAVPRQKELMPPDFDRSDFGLKAPPHVATHQGLIFANWDPEAKPLQEELGAMTHYLDTLLGGTDEGYEVYGPPARRLIRSNWKVGAENFAGDSYHLAATHESAANNGAFGDPDQFYQFQTVSHHINVGNGHVARLEQMPFRPDPPMFMGQPPEASNQFERNLSPEQVQLQSATFILHGNIFPNLSYMQTSARVGDDFYTYVWFGLWQPTGPQEVEYLNWHLFPKAASAEWKKAAHFAVVNSVGHAGYVAADDTEIVESMVAANRGAAAREEDFIYVLGSHFPVQADSDYPGERVVPGVSESNQRYFYQHWDKSVNGERSV